LPEKGGLGAIPVGFKRNKKETWRGGKTLQKSISCRGLTGRKSGGKGRFDERPSDRSGTPLGRRLPEGKHWTKKKSGDTVINNKKTGFGVTRKGGVGEEGRLAGLGEEMCDVAGSPTQKKCREKGGGNRLGWGESKRSGNSGLWREKR